MTASDKPAHTENTNAEQAHSPRNETANSPSDQAIDHTTGRAISMPIRMIGGLMLCLLPFIMSSSTPPTLLERIQEEGFLQILTLNGPSTFYEGRLGYAGFEYELAKAFADDIGVEITVRTEQSLGDILSGVQETSAHFVAAGLSVIDERKQTINFSVPYSTVTQQVVYRRGSERPKSVSDIVGKDIVVVKQSSHAKTLEGFKDAYPELTWREEEAEMTDLLDMIHKGEADITLVDSTAFITNSAIYPRARAAFDIAEPEVVAWAFPKRKDVSLLNAANAFLQDYRESGAITKLEDKYFKKPVVDESSALAFSSRIEKRLPQWEGFFKGAAKKYELDWLFLAAMSYQESLWNKDAKSFTGVRGLMMLTHKTARDLGVKDRTDPQQSIYGGAEYFTQIRKRIPKDIVEPDRTWMALAAYNVGFGHLEDARVITQRQGGDPHLWDEVKARLPLLTKRKYYSQTRHGYARGWEPVHYVENIRNYHNILIWHYDQQQKQLANEPENELEVELEQAIEKTPIDIKSLPQL